MRLLSIVILWSLWGDFIAAAEIPPAEARIAILSDAADKDLAALITSELSNTGRISLVERDDLIKIGDESKLQQLANNDSVALGKLIGADGLIFLNKSPDGIQVRFTAAGLGYALFDDRFESAADLPHLAQIIAQRVTDYAPKLKLRPEEAIPISILNLRADVATTDSSNLERKLTLLLESRLAAVPKYVILERRHVSAVKFERTLSNASQTPMQGVSVIDGTFTPPPEGKTDLVVNLRLRRSGGEPTSVEIRGSSKDLPALAEEMTAAIGPKMGIAPDAATWQPQKEAREYLLEGIWGSQHNANEAALEALDSAELLGQNLPDVMAIRIPVFCAVAVGSSKIFMTDATTPDDPHPEARVEAMLRAFSDESVYETNDMGSKLQDAHPDQSELGNAQMRRWAIVRAAASLLKMLDSTQNPQADEVRTAFRAFVGYDPLHGKLPQDLSSSIRYADALSESADEEKAYYRIYFAASADSLGWREMNGSLYRDTYCTRFFPDPHERYIAYLAFLKSMYDGPTRLTALLGYANAIIPEDIRHDAAMAFYQALTDQRDSLLATNQLAPYLYSAFDLERSRGMSEADPKVIALLHFLLQHSDHLDRRLTQAWYPNLFPAPEAPALWKDFQALEAKPSGDPLASQIMRRNYMERFADANTTPNSLEVNRFWYPPNAPGKPEFASHPMITASDGVWMAASFVNRKSGQESATAVFYHVMLDASHPNPFSTKSFQIPAFDPQAMTATSDAIFVIGCPWKEWGKTLVERLNLTSENFEKHEVPTASNIYTAGSGIYLALRGTGMGEIESGIDLLNDRTCETTILASSRRRPAQNQFDDRSFYTVSSIFIGPGGKPCAALGFGEIYGIEDKPGPWSRVIPSGCLLFSETQGSRTLLYGQSFNGNALHQDVVFMVDSTKPNPELWLGAPGPLMGTEMVGRPEPLPPQPDWSQRPLWEQPTEVGPIQSVYGFRGDDLFSFVIHQQTQQKELLWYQHGRPVPTRIPLNFKLGDDATLALKAMDEADDDPLKKQRPPNNSPLKMFCASQGLCFVSPAKGFWFLPFNDIEAYLKSTPH